MTSWYQPPTNPTPIDSMPNSEDEASEADLLNEGEIGSLEESPISFRLSVPNEELSRNGYR